MPKKRTGKDKGALMLVRLSSLADLARYVYNFDFTFENVFTDGTQDGGSVLYAFGSKIDGRTLVFTLPIKERGIAITYRPPESSEPETARLVQEYDQTGQGINIIRMPLKELGVSKPQKAKAKMVQLSSMGDLVKLAIKSSPKDGLADLYSFEDSGRRFIYGVDLVDQLNDHDAIIYYAETELGKAAGFAMYDYKSGKVMLTDSVGEHSYMYLKIINLAEKPQFFGSK